ncbi:MAG: hypothetical protein KGJ13_13140, partial [Patescibacteria group bacterium]|nr:hypothetical protein [Patescibacteria group bacterium]
KSDVDEIILHPMQLIFRSPYGFDDEQISLALREYADTLSNFDRADLTVAWQEVRESHQSHSWPPVAAFASVARKSRNDRLQAASGHRKGSSEANKAWERWKVARGTKKALEAAKHGFAWSLKCKILDGHDIDSLDMRQLYQDHQRATKLADALQDGLVIEHPSPQNGTMKEYSFSPETANAALGLWRQIQNKEAETASEIQRAQCYNSQGR